MSDMANCALARLLIRQKGIVVKYSVAMTEDEAIEFKETEDGFLAKVAIKDKRQRVKPIAIGLLWTLLSPAIGFAVFGVLFALAKSGMYVPSRRVLFIALLAVLAVFVFSVALLIKAVAACVECTAEIRSSHGAVVCRRWLFGRLPLPARRFTLSPWSRATGGTCGSKLTDSDFDTVKIWSDGEYGTPCLPLIRTYARTAFMLAFRINRANKWDDASYRTARRAHLANPPRGMKIRPTDDGQGRIAVIRPFSLHGILYVVLVAQVAALVSLLAYIKIPYIGWVLGLLIAVAAAAGCLFWVLRGLFGFARWEVGNGQMHCIDGLWPFVRKRDVSLEGVVPCANGDFGWWDDLFEHRDPFSWLPPKFRLPLRLFVEEEIALNSVATIGRRFGE